MKSLFIILIFSLSISSFDKYETMNNLEIVTLGAGCFWCVEAIFEKIEGVEKVVSGYSGGHKINPTYKEVCNGTTGHAEVIQVTFNSEIITLSEILDVFFQVHNPTTLNRQGADVGTQYRSVIFYHDESHEQIAKKSKEKWNDSGKYTDSIVTEISKFENFYVAEDYHQEYFENNPYQPYCSFVIEPKVKKFMKEFKPILKDD
jgi:peptide-methionine (S)-S-oxide reductase